MPDTPLPPANSELVLRILRLAHEIHTQTPLCAFCDYSGHVNQISVRIAESKSAWNRKVYDRSCYFHWQWKLPAETHAELKAICDDLEKLLLTRRVKPPEATPPLPPPTPMPEPPARPVAAKRGGKKRLVLGHYKEALKGGPLHAQQLAKRIGERSGAAVTQMDVYRHLRMGGLVAVTRAKSDKGRAVDLLSLP